MKKNLAKIFFFQAEDGIRDTCVTGVQTCALPIFEEADVILFVVDVQNGVTDLDDEVAHILRRSKKPVVLVPNKADTYDWHAVAAEFYRFGLGDPYCISAMNGSYTGDLLDRIIELLPSKTPEILEEALPRITVVRHSVIFAESLREVAEIGISNFIAYFGYKVKTNRKQPFWQRDRKSVV